MTKEQFERAKELEKLIDAKQEKLNELLSADGTYHISIKPFGNTSVGFFTDIKSNHTDGYLHHANVGAECVEAIRVHLQKDLEAFEKEFAEL